uniref:Regulatory protein zeste n=2 Tax=Drosophila melanogaster TaxID=7227 RepID=Q8MLN2_DROME|nr:uncharacterized protein Dmel_CG30428, isoform A [Drosophila melanogaster]AAM68333.1 uncharacterized protein Dmel_CG30428, isoform A [Drosophila melanogaster]|eukprot:NP_726513.1 uncharacterized protein Dmel_CG30428, isoform A [Drosophila melanogaster]
MGKHRTAQQDAIFVAFMERHPIISKNYLKGDKQAAEAAWKRLSNELNSVGPPVKEASEWKRVWKDWKSCIRKKITNNRLENSKATGKGSLYQDTLTPLEDAVAVICDLYDMADTIAEGCPKDQTEMAHGVSLKFIKTDQDDSRVKDNQYYKDEDCSINIRRFGGQLEHSANTSQTTSKKRKRFKETALEIEQERSVPVLLGIARELSDLNRQSRLNAQRTKANTEALLALSTQIADLMQQQLKERKRLNAIIEKFVLKMESSD